MSTESQRQSRLAYPSAPTGPQFDTYHGVTVADPYRWLENADSPETRAWVEAENALTAQFLCAASDTRDAIRQRLTRLWDYEKIGLPSKYGGRYFYSKNTGLQNQYVLYVADSLEGEGRVLLDPNTLSDDGTVALSGLSISEDGKYLAYSIADAGSDWQEWRVRDIDTGSDLSDHIRWVKFSGVSWTRDGAGFFYSRYEQPKEGAALQEANYFQKLYFHRLGDDQAQDTLIYERPDQKEWGLGGTVTEDGAYLIIGVWQGTDHNNRVFYKPLAGTDASADVVELLPLGDASYHFVDNDGPVFYFQTDKDAPLGRLISIDMRTPDPTQWRELIPEAPETLRGVSLFGNQFIVTYLKDARTQVKVFGIDGTFAHEIELPGIGSAFGFGGRRTDTETFYSFAGFTTPSTSYRYDLTTGTSTVYKQAKVDFNPDDYETKQVFFASKDGTRIPMFVTHKKGIVLDGSNPTYLYAYGGFNAALTPYFSPSPLVWMEMGGVYAVANIRGGGEYGEVWHEAGRKLKKQNVFDDFIAAAEYLIREKYTSSERLAVAGGSNGGLLIGACMTQRPDLYGACLPAVGVMDMLRFPLFTIGWAWTTDYGTPENPEDFKNLYAYSPYHNLKPETRYPATLITTSDHDDRVVPAHSYKFAAALQAAQAPDGPPTLIRVETRAGHGAGKPTAKIIEEISDIYAFLAETLHFSLPDDFGK